MSREPRNITSGHHRGLRRPEFVGCECGTAILEFALILPILFIILGGTFEICRALIIRQTMIEAVRGGAGYLARVPDPTCDPTCSPGVVRAVGITLDQILENSNMSRAAVRVTPHWDAATEMVAMQANVMLNADLLRVLGLGPIMTLEAFHRERRNAE